MIIQCVNCHKKFNVDPMQIPDVGRIIQCGSCNHSWYFKKDKKIEKQNITNDQISEDKNKENNSINSDLKISLGSKINIFFSKLIVYLISFIALIIFIDTLKTPLINIFPGLEIVFFNIYETLKDLKLFIIDLF